jgi:hypothetical protein
MGSGAVPTELATDHLVPLDTIGNRPELTPFLKLYETAPEAIRADMTRDLIAIGDKPYNLVRMSGPANSGVKGSRYWSDITYDEVKRFGYEAADVDRMRAQEGRTLERLLQDIADLTRKYEHIIGGGGH